MAKTPDSQGLTWDEASPSLRSIVADNQRWAEANGHAPKGTPSHGALRMREGREDPFQERSGDLSGKKRPR